ncbi:putative formate transporter [Tetrabaena socialis]|uniref:Putative formate transporter n=1 Tax=Tetrabaena socialis TaxID=47790 RepID=A0A2J8AGW1_9CHLO|nr:putative formate transporter [Tetrabaena socialis]|eukprot:PNH11758.1 putative formate transporter [Tetrabaena socialis]
MQRQAAPSVAQRCLRTAMAVVPRPIRAPAVPRLPPPRSAAASADTGAGAAAFVSNVLATALPPAAPPALLAPAALYDQVVQAGARKAQLPLAKAFAMALLAGAYICFGGLLSYTLLNSMPGLLASSPGLAKLLAAAVFPFGLALIIICGGELFTSNTAFLAVAVYEGKAKWSDVLVRWAVVYAGNLVGCLAMVAAVGATGLMAANTVLPAMAVAKTSLPLAQVLARSVLCNWLVCLAVWTATASGSLPGKLMGIWLPITAFVTVGLEHSVANMFIIPMGMMLGAPVSPLTFLTANLLPVTLGNLVAGALCVGGMYSVCFGKLGQGL